MAPKTGGKTSGYTFMWKIENISHYWLKEADGIESPLFVAKALKGTKWWLQLNPISKEDVDYISCYIYRDEDCSGPDVIKVSYQIAFLDQDGLILQEGTSVRNSFVKGDNSGFPKFVTRDRVFVTECKVFLPEDTLTIQCTIWNKKNKPIKPKYLYGRTVFRVNRGSFMWRIEEMNSLESDLRKKFTDNFIDIDLIQNNELDFENKFVIKFNSFHEDIEYFSFKTSIVDSEGKRENCETHENFADELMRGVFTLRLFSKNVTENKRQYLQNDVHSLLCEYFIVTETNINDIFDPEISFSNLTTEVVDNIYEQDVGKLKSQNPSVLDDLKSMYSDAILCDTELRTSTHTFPTHKTILSARSPVFRSMFSNDLKVRNCGHVEITDLEDDIIHRMLLYIYTDSLEDLQLDSASKLYAAADKYQIPSLKARCSSFLKDNLCLGEVCDVLGLADLHQDDDLKSFVEDYILDHDREVFGSQEWKDFMYTHPKLAALLMYRKVFPG